MKISEAIAAVNGRAVPERYNDKEISGAEVDSRRIKPGCVFIATVGEKTDGHSYISRAFELGAVCAVCEHVPADMEPDADTPCIIVPDSIAALKTLAAVYRSGLSCRIVGIVGSVGKTSTKELVASVLGRSFRTHKTEGNFNNEIGVPLTLMGIRPSDEMAVVEMGISDFGEMNRLGSMVRPDAVVMTNIGPCHLEKLIDLAGVLRAKSEVFEWIAKDGALFLNMDDPMLAGVDGPECDILGYGTDSCSSAEDIVSHGPEGTDCTIRLKALKHGDMRARGSEKEAGSPDSRICDEVRIAVHVPLPGSHMVQNALAAALVGRYFGMEPEAVAEGIASVRPVSGRSNLIRVGGLLLVDDCYNANPKSMMSAIDMIKEASGRRVAILGDMFELGENERALHAGVGRYAAESGIEQLMCVGNLSREMYEAAAASLTGKCVTVPEDGAEDVCTDPSGSRTVRYFVSVDELMNAIRGGMHGAGLSAGDTVLVKASHGMGFAEVVKAIKELFE